MGYEDFVWFILSGEDKGHDLSLEYWLCCCDLGCNLDLCSASSHGGVQAVRPLASGVAGKMGYEDLV